jgi:hypothetical protein
MCEYSALFVGRPDQRENITLKIGRSDRLSLRLGKVGLKKELGCAVFSTHVFGSPLANDLREKWVRREAGNALLLKIAES